MQDVKVKVLTKEPCKISALFEIDKGVVHKHIEDIFKEIQKEVQIPGFRTGKAPMDIVKKEFSKTAQDRALHRLSLKTVYDYLEKEKIKSLSTPVISDISFAEDKNFTFKIEIERHPEITIKNYKKIKLRKKEKVITDADVENQLKILQDENSTLVPDLTGTVTKESFVVIDYDLYLDGKIIPNASMQNFLVDMSNSAANVKGLTEALLGAKTGDKKSVPTTFPKEHPNKNLAGKTAILEATVRDIKKKNPPPINDDFAKDLGFESLEKLKEAIKNSLQIKAQQQTKDDLKNQIEEYLLKNNNFDVPASLVMDYQKSMLESMKNYWLSAGATEDDWNKNKAAAEQKALVEARNTIRLFYIYDAIAIAEKITVTQEDIEKTKEVFAKIYEKNIFEEKWNRDLALIKYDILKEKILKFLIDNANITVSKD